MEIAIIGAGMAGLACAGGLQAGGHRVTLFDKSRSAGGRMATRRVATPLGEAQFDHGAQYFTVRDPGFRTQVENWRTQGVALPWPAAGSEAWVGVPGMNAPAKAMAARCTVHWSARVDVLEPQRGGWTVRGDGIDAGRFDRVVVALPAEQAAALLAPCAAAFAAKARGVPSLPGWTVMLAFDQRLAFAADTIRDAGMIGWAARNSAKPARSGPEAWVVQADPAWSAAHLEDSPDAVVAALQRSLAAVIGTALPEPLAAVAHRWRYARSGALGVPSLWDAAHGIGVCGDWLIGPRVEAAWQSGIDLAGRMTA